MFKKFALGLVALVSLFGAVQVASPVAAQASVVSQVQVQAAHEIVVVADLQGPAGYLSFWDGCGSPAVGYCGAAWALSPSGGLNVCHAVPTGSNDKFTAFSNNSGHNFRVWTAAGCTGSSATLYNGTEAGVLGSGFNNTISSQERIS